MSTVLIITGSPSLTSKTELVGKHIAQRLSASDCDAEHLRLRTLPAAPLLGADTSNAEIADAVNRVAKADGIVLATPTFKAAYSGLLKTFLDLLPQYAFAGKVVLPLATGGSLAHVLALDYGLRPVVHSMGARQVVQSFFLLSSHLFVEEDRLSIDPASEGPLEGVLAQFQDALDCTPRRTAFLTTADAEV
ncbi:NADPH-dependent FMN reductase [Saccharopolyspora sp. NPDC000359]|uniref:NADPH-dependent FMN reductase n=1 Tax=Saccharopolyspora sp. NPDC000359 TaxID=3154251 RepID=UPI003319AC78